MLGLFNKKKTHLSRAEFVAFMLSWQQEITSFLLESAHKWCEKFPMISFQPDPYECEILSLCILSLVFQDKDFDLRNTIYIEYCRHRNFDNDTTKRFLEHLNLRCIRYYNAYSEFAKGNRSGGFFLGSVVANGLKGGESDKIELGMVESYAASSIFINSLKSTFEFIGDLKKKYDLSEAIPVFVEK